MKDRAVMPNGPDAFALEAVSDLKRRLTRRFGDRLEFNMAEKARLEADCSRGGPSVHAAQTMLADAERFVAAVSMLLSAPPR